MKLQTKTNYRFLVLLLIVFVFAGSVLYIVLGLVVNNNLDETLQHRSEIVKQSILNKPTIKAETISVDKALELKPIKWTYTLTKFYDTTIFDNNENEYINFRKIKFGIKIHNENYEASIVESKLETEDLVELIFYFMLGLFTIIAFILFFFNRWISLSLWTPFNNTLYKLNNFRIDLENNVNFDKSDIYEFEQLNNTLNKMVQKVQADYKNLKEFTENASHEIQTPLAIIKSKLESVLQDSTIQNTRYQQIQSAFETITRLSKLNKSLLLLSKIENLQFHDVTEINLCNLVSKSLLFIDELVALKNIKITTNISQPFKAIINSHLAEILINNLLGNAVKHNYEGGQIEIKSAPSMLIITNTGKQLTIDPNKLFSRFAKHNTGNESTGLGLAIAYEICEKSGLKLDYNFENGLHCLVLSLNSQLASTLSS
jgi:signal transduction histidine kinase